MPLLIKDLRLWAVVEEMGSTCNVLEAAFDLAEADELREKFEKKRLDGYFRVVEFAPVEEELD